MNDGTSDGTRDRAVYIGIAPERVIAATGTHPDEWFRLLDDAGAADMSHRDIAAHLVTEHEVAGWWAQHVTVAYEHARGRRQKHQHADGYAVSKSKTVAAPAEAVFDALVHEATRRRWLDVDLEVTSATPAKYVHGRMGASRVSIMLTRKGETKTVVALQHRRLADAEAGEAAKVRWGQRLERLADLLTDSVP